ncbi:MAG: hypothetical protein SGPRY_007164, partial [Prymnesium sp.]
RLLAGRANLACDINSCRHVGSVSLLTHFECAADLNDWEIGVHGVWIDFIDLQNKPRSAVYLPDVMPEQGAP